MSMADATPNQGRAAATSALAALPVRIFLGIKVTPEIAHELIQITTGLKERSVRLVAPADIHLTLVPPRSEASIPEAVERLRRVAGKFGAFWLTFEHVGYGPQPRRPRLLWADCAATDEIAGLRAALLEAYGQSDERPFRPHVTLARIRGNAAAIARNHPVDCELSLKQYVETNRALSITHAKRERLPGPRLLAVRRGRSSRYPLMQSSGLRRATRRASPASSAAATTALTSL